MALSLVRDYMVDKYCSACYTSKHLYPFGFCRKCWVEHGSPQPMLGVMDELE